MEYDLLIKGANLYFGKGRLETEKDIAIKGDRIMKVGEKLEASLAAQVIDATGMLVTPGFNDTHMHIDLSYTFDYDLEVPSLIGGVKLFRSFFDQCGTWSRDQLYDYISDLCSRTIDACVRNGTTTIKTNVSYMDTWKAVPLDVIIDLKEKYRDKCNILNAVMFCNPMPDPIFENEVLPQYHKAAAEGKVDFIAVYPHKHPNGKEVIDTAFELAKKYNLPIDMHCDESDVPDLTCFQYVLKKTVEEGMQGMVTCGHVTALSSFHLNDDEAAEIIKDTATADVNITSLTSCNMYLMNMNRRGPTRVRELLAAGVNVAVASDDIREVLRPFGNCDLLEEALLSAQVHKMGTTKLLRQAFDLVTYNGARNCGFTDYGLDPGCRADLVVLAAPSPELAILNQCKKPYVLKNGCIVASNNKLV